MAMSEPGPVQRFAGLHCPQCGYDVRGLPAPICPECGRAFDPDMPAALVSRRQVATGWLSAMVAVGLALFVIVTGAKATLVHAREMGSWCGTGRLMCYLHLSSTLPKLLILAAVATGISAQSGVGYRVARTALLSAAVAWAVCYALMRWGM
jgi:hypothetical protein